MTKYKAVLFAPDGDWVTDFKGDSKEEVWNKLADKGSRWYFYPYEAIILDKGALTASRQRLVAACSELESFIGQSIKTVSKHLKDYSLEK